MRCSSKFFQVLVNFISKTKDAIFLVRLSQSSIFKGPMKGPISSFFRRAPCTLPPRSKNLAKMQFVGILFEALLKVIIETFPK